MRCLLARGLRLAAAGALKVAEVLCGPRDESDALKRGRSSGW